MRRPLTVDDLELSPEGELAREDARAEVAALEPLAAPPKPPKISASHAARKANHDRFLDRTFGRRNWTRSLRGTTPPYEDTAEMAWRLGGENEEVPDATLPVYLEPVVNDGRLVFGASLTCRPQRFDPTCPMFGDAPEQEDLGLSHVELAGGPSLADVREAVAEWLETLYEPFSAPELADLTEYPLSAVTLALCALRQDGKVACQLWRESYPGAPMQASWVWRRLALH